MARYLHTSIFVNDMAACIKANVEAAEAPTGGSGPGGAGSGPGASETSLRARSDCICARSAGRSSDVVVRAKANRVVASTMLAGSRTSTPA